MSDYVSIDLDVLDDVRQLAHHVEKAPKVGETLELRVQIIDTDGTIAAEIDRSREGEVSVDFHV